MDIPMIPGGKRALAALVFAAAAVWGLIRFGERAVSRPATPVAVSVPAAAPVIPKKAARRKLASIILAEPVDLVKTRGSRLRDKGEAFGGRTPDRVDTGTMTVPSSQ